MDILVELPVDQWPVLLGKLKQFWPYNLPGFYTLQTNLKYPALREAFQFKVYCPYGDMENGFIGLSSIGKQECIMFSITEDTSKLEEAIVKTKRINTSSRVYFDLLSSITVQAFDRVRKQLNRHDGPTTKKNNSAKMYVLDGSTKPFSELREPDNTYLAPVKQQHIAHVDESWPYKHEASHHFFSTLASNGLSYGLYSSDTHELLAWIFINNYSFLCHWFCEEKCRRRGYGEYVIKYAVNDLLKDGNDVYAYVVYGNDKPMSIFKELGFKHVDESYWTEL